MRRWFEDDDFQLIVWSKANEITAFELTYELEPHWRIIKWSRARGLKHYQADGDESKAHKPQPAVELQDLNSLSKSQAHQVARRFDATSRDIDATIARFVYHTLLRHDPNPARW